MYLSDRISPVCLPYIHNLNVKKENIIKSLYCSLVTSNMFDNVCDLRNSNAIESCSKCIHKAYSVGTLHIPDCCFLVI